MFRFSFRFRTFCTGIRYATRRNDNNDRRNKDLRKKECKRRRINRRTTRRRARRGELKGG